MTTWLTRWPLGEAAATVTQLPSRERPCSPYVALLGDWHDAPRGGGRPHYAQDIMAPRGTPVLAPCSGRVRFSGWGPVAGYQVQLTSQGGTVQLSHFDTQPVVEEGDQVEPGELLGYVGNTGNRASRTCPHLHIGVKDSRRQPVNIYSELVALAPARRVRPGPTPDTVRLPPAPADGLAAVAVVLGLAAAVAEKVLGPEKGRA